MTHRLILFTGSSPGVGKSTLSGLLFEQFHALEIPVHWLHEEDMVETFERFVPGLNVNQLSPDQLLQATQRLVEQCQTEDATWIIDSYLPGFYYLYGRCPDAELEVFSRQLRGVLDPLQPLAIYLRSDVETALMRGAAQRGAQWLETITRYLNGWELPAYDSPMLKPLRTVPDVIEFFDRSDHLAVRLLKDWSDTLILDTTHQSIDQLRTAILSHLELPEQDTGYRVSAAELERYPGVYLPTDDSTPLEITLVDGALFVNTYWPSGARLLPEGEHTFRLEGTNRHLVFEEQAKGQVTGLRYQYRDVIQQYQKQTP